MRLRARRQPSQFWPILTCFVDYYSPFLGPEAISIVVEPQVVLTCWSSTLAVWPILACFMDYYSPFWDPKMISILVEAQGALTCRSSRLAVLADSGLFHGLPLTISGSRSGFHG